MYDAHGSNGGLCRQLHQKLSISDFVSILVACRRFELESAAGKSCPKISVNPKLPLRASTLSTSNLGSTSVLHRHSV